MRKIIILVGVLGASVVGHAQQQLETLRPDDRPFYCGAVTVSRMVGVEEP
ncbi:hypothetical protein [Bosea sp. Root381]|nr:hypothetical protein [Bosea sp. Root381]